jgi:hypothetical protein
MRLMARIKATGVVLLAAGLLAGGYTVIEGSPSQRVHKPKRSPAAPAPSDDDRYVHVKLAMVIDGEISNSSPKRITIQYTVGGVKYPPGSGAHFPTDRYWYRVLRVLRGTEISLGATNLVPDQVVDLFIYRVNAKGDGTRVLAHDVIPGVGGGYCATAAR